MMDVLGENRFCSRMPLHLETTFLRSGLLILTTSHLRATLGCALAPLVEYMKPVGADVVVL